MLFDFDTGSDWLWVPTNPCTSCLTPHKHTIAAPDVSTSTPGNITYGDGSTFSGTIYTTSVYVGSSLTAVTTMKAIFVTTYKDPTVATVSPFDGLCGLTPKSLDGSS